MWKTPASLLKKLPDYYSKKRASPGLRARHSAPAEKTIYGFCWLALAILLKKLWTASLACRFAGAQPWLDSIIRRCLWGNPIRHEQSGRYFARSTTRYTDNETFDSGIAFELSEPVDSLHRERPGQACCSPSRGRESLRA